MTATLLGALCSADACLGRLDYPTAYDTAPVPPGAHPRSWPIVRAADRQVVLANR
jgi:hypothetical protein